MLKYSLIAALVVALPTAAQAGSILSSGNVMLGVKDTGALNEPGGPASPRDGTTIVGVRYIPTGNEATAHGCVCEGWGVGVADTGVWGGDGGANTGGPQNLTVESFTSTATTATSVVSLSSGELRVTHDFSPSASGDLYQVRVTIENTSGADIADLRYTRAMDWDVEPTTFSEYVTIQGTAGATNVLYAHDDGFESTNPFAGRSPIVAGSVGDFVDTGPSDHGALFDFGFGALAAGATRLFDIFYGASKTEAQALAALGTVGAEVYSFGQINSDPLGLGLDDAFGRPSNTFIFAFKGVGGKPVDPPGPAPIPVPAAGFLLLGALGALGASRKLRKAG